MSTNTNFYSTYLHIDATNNTELRKVSSDDGGLHDICSAVLERILGLRRRTIEYVDIELISRKS